MRSRSSARSDPLPLRTWLLAMLCVTAGAHAVLYGIVAVQSLTYPYVLEWMEGGTMEVIARVVQGQPLYVEPSLEYVPYLYPPLYFWVSGLVASVAGVVPAVPRTVSLLSTMATALLLGLFAYREAVAWRDDLGKPGGTAPYASAVAAAGLFLASFEIAGKWFHLARVDALYLLLLVAAAYMLRFHRGARGTLAGGLLAVLAVMTKQTALVALGPVLLLAAFEARHRALILAGCGVALLGTLALLHVSTDGWSDYFLWGLPLRHPLGTARMLRFWTSDILTTLPFAVACAGVVLAIALRRPSASGRFHLALAVGFVGSAWLARLHSGGYLNVLLPACVLLALLTGIAASLPIRPPRTRVSLSTVATVAAVVQMLFLLYDPARAVPSGADHRANERLIAALAAMEGEVLVPGQRYVSRLAGKSTFGLGMAAQDVLRATPGDWVAHRLRRERDQAVASRRFSAIVLNRAEDVFPALRRHYRRAGTLVEGNAGRPVTGAPYRPSLLYVPAP